MRQAAPKILKSPSSSQGRKNIKKKIKTIIKSTHTPELVISICGYMGSNVHKVTGVLQELLKHDFDYKVDEPIQLSDFIKNWLQKKGKFKKNLPRFDHVKMLIDGGNQMRKEYDSNVLAQLAIHEITKKRTDEKEQKKNKNFKPRRHCCIIDSLKNKEELELLRLVYGDIHYSIGVFSPLEMRKKKLEDDGMTEIEINKLIDRDSGEEIPYGQAVRDTFTKSDFFLRIDSSSEKELKTRLKRYLNLIFGTEVVTPTCDETAMYMAASASGNSACLSRQVGAALTDSNGELISVGWNDVPKFGGNLYQTSLHDPNAKHDHRCVNLGNGCYNDVEKNLISKELVKDLVKANLIKNEDKIIKKTFNVIRNSKIKSLVEFSRAIHAEMHALILGCQKDGNRIKNGILYITTYPCHICARHIVASGIKDVYYIEPYRKSLTMKLHFDSMTEDEKEPNKVRLLMFDGVAPNKYFHLFKMNEFSRKDIEGAGIPQKYDSRKTLPKITLTLESLPTIESVATRMLSDWNLI